MLHSKIIAVCSDSRANHTTQGNLTAGGAAKAVGLKCDCEAAVTTVTVSPGVLIG